MPQNSEIERSRHEVIVDAIKIDRRSDTPKYRQIYYQLRQLIVQQRLKPSMRLPSTRVLAATLSIARNTVITAYEQLEADGFIETSTGSLSRVSNISTHSDLDNPKPLPDMLRSLSERGRNIVTHEHYSGSPNPGLLFPGLPDVREFPFTVWRRLVTARLKPSPDELFSYHSYAGFQPLRDAVATYAQSSRGVRCSPDQVLITSGAQNAFNLLAHLLIDAGDHVLLEDPGYSGAQCAFLAADAKLLPLRVSDSGWQLDNNCQARPKLIYLTPSCQYPLGIKMRMEQRVQVLDMARTIGSWIIEDDFDSEFRFSTEPLPALQGIDQNDRTIYVGTFAKTLFPSLRIGFVIFPRKVDNEVVKANFLLGAVPPLLLQAALADFIEQGHFARHLRRMKKLYKARRYHFMQLALSLLDDLIEPIDAGSGLQTTWRLTSGESDVQVCRRAQRAGLGVTPLSVHYLFGLQLQGLMIGYASMSEEAIDTSLMTLRSVLQQSHSS